MKRATLPGVMSRILVLPALLLAALLAPSPAAAQTSVFGGAVACAPSEGVLFCPGTAATRVRTFDDVPLDVNVTLPAAGGSALPLVVLLHGWGGKKEGLSGSKAWAQRGYAVLSFTARGFNESCGMPQFRDDPVCPAKGWIRLADTRFEVRDSQHLAGLLVDEGIADPVRIGATGGSYGGGQSLALAMLKDRVMKADGTFEAWRSHKGTPMRLAAAAPWIPWSDLVYSLTPNGRSLDYVVHEPADFTTVPGVAKQSFNAGLFALGAASGHYAAPGVDPQADLPSWFARVNAGEPYSDPNAQSIFAEISAHHEAFSLPLPAGGPAPLLISNGWTDDLFPVDEALRMVNRLRAESPATPITQLYMDYGHQRGKTTAAERDRLDAWIAAWFDHYVKGGGAAPPQQVEAVTQTCPKAAGTVLSAPTWGELHPGEVRLKDPATKTLSSAGGDEAVSRAVDPIAGGGDACATTASGDVPQTATYRFDAATGDGFTLAGSATVIADVTTSGVHPQIAARLWDVGPDGRQNLVARGVYRPEAGGRQVFQLHPNAYRFARGHVAKLELLGRDAPYARASNGAFTVTVTGAEIRLPVAEKPGTGPVQVPSAPLLPAGAVLARDAVMPGAPAARPIAASRPPRRVRGRIRYPAGRRGRCGGARIRLGGPGVAGARYIDVRAGSRRLARDRSAPFAFRLRGSRLTRVSRISLRIVRADASQRTVVRRLRRCRV